MSARPLPPLRFAPRTFEKVWGGRRLAALGIDLPPDTAIGEVWLVVDRAEEQSVVASGPYAGQTLDALMQAHASALLGRSRRASNGRFPLLVKYIDASQPLSVQVHPGPHTPPELGESKTEAWYLLAADEDARLWTGLADGVTVERLAQAAGTPACVQLLAQSPARAGECILIEGGTVHAIGGGSAILEVQQNSDTTWRLYDWDRPGLDGRPRRLDVPQALRCARPVNFTPRPARVVEESPGWQRSKLVDCELFRMDLLELDGERALATEGYAQVLTMLEGSGRLQAGAFEVSLQRGEAWLLPASLGDYLLSGRLRAVRATALS